jgi:HPt (histidine-containing phosphotransfer) domain-containing protein
MTGKAVDLEHLARYTGGDRAIDAEILTLFDNQLREMMTRLSGLADGADWKSWREIAHTLKGAARGVGAFAVADNAASLESVSGDPQAASAALEQLKISVAAAQEFIATFLKSGV